MITDIHVLCFFEYSWQICTVLFLGALQSFLYLTVAHTAAEDVPNFMMAQLFCWSPSWLGGMFVAWSLFAADALASQRATTPPSRVRRLFHSPMFINLHFILVAVVCLSVMFGVSYWASQQYTILIADFRIIQRDLLDHWAPLYATLPYDEVATALKANTPVLQDLLDHLKHFTLAFRIAWGWWWAFTLYLYGVRRSRLRKDWLNPGSHSALYTAPHLAREPVLRGTATGPSCWKGRRPDADT